MIIDTSVWISLLDEDDSCHKAAIKLVENISPQEIYLLDYIYCETMTVLRRKKLEFKIVELMNFISEAEIGIRFIDKFLFNLSSSFFLKFRKLSFTDCILLATAKHNSAQLVTFDRELLKAHQEISNL